jgi:hypothetical protein
MMASISLIPEASAIRRGSAGMLTAPRRVSTTRVDGSVFRVAGAAEPEFAGLRLHPASKTAANRQTGRIVMNFFILYLLKKIKLE